MTAINKSEKYMGDLERTEIGEDGLFDGDHARHIKSASDVLNDMCWIKCVELDGLKDDKISDQKKIVQLQSLAQKKM